MTEVPIRPAATIVVVTEAPELRVAMLRRREASSFVGGMSVFPGGGVDEHDRDDRWAASHPHPTAAERLPLDDAQAYWIAAIRETWEEANLFLGSPAPPPRRRFEVDRGDRHFHDAIGSAQLDQESLVPIGRWITPPGAPRRYDTIFFVASIPTPAAIEPDGTEAVTAEWVTPATALAEFSAGNRAMLPPTSVTLEIISTYPDAATLVRAARAAAPLADQHRLHRLQVGDAEPQYYLPGQSAPSHARPAEGWISIGNHTPGTE